MSALMDFAGEKAFMTRDVINRVAFAIQDESMSRLDALRYARAALSALEAGDRFNGWIVLHRSEASDVMRQLNARTSEHGADL